MQPPGNLENHPAFDVLGNAHDGVLEASKLENLTDAVLLVLRRAAAATQFARARLKTADADLVAGGVLENIQSAAAEIVDNAAQYSSKRNDAQLTVVVQATNRILVALSNILTITSPSELTAVVESAATYKATLDGATATARASIEELKKSFAESYQSLTQTEQHARERMEQGTSESIQKVDALASQISDERQKLLNLTAEYQSQFSTSQDQRAKDALEAKNVEQEKARVLFDEYNKRLLAFDTSLEKEARERAAAFQEGIDNLRAEQVKQARDILEGMLASKAQVENLVGVIGNLGVTSGYLRQANVARRVMWFWQLLAVAALALLVFIAVRAFLPAAEGAATFTWQTFASRISIAIAIGLFAAYAATQGEKASNQERRNRRLALELEAIGPFLAPMNPDDQQKFRYQIGEKSFGVDPDVGAATFRRERDSATIVGHLLKSKEFRGLIEGILRGNHA